MAADTTVLAVDQGTSATKAILVDRQGAVIASASAPMTQSHPEPGWAEQDALEIWKSVQAVVADCLQSHDPRSVAAVGLSTQRESTLLWERESGRPLGPVLGWQDGRGVLEQDCADAQVVRQRPYFVVDFQIAEQFV